jgi:tRNA(fMet)-specific endonuclease VapC
MIYVLDTNICNLLQREHPLIRIRIDSLPEGDGAATTIITVSESISGWLPFCKRAPDGRSKARAYEKLYEIIAFYQGMICLPFSEASGIIFDQLRRQKIRIGTNDLAIVAITLSINGILITRNTVDFERITNLTIEDWTK